MVYLRAVCCHCVRTSMVSALRPWPVHQNKQKNTEYCQPYPFKALLHHLCHLWWAVLDTYVFITGHPKPSLISWAVCQAQFAKDPSSFIRQKSFLRLSGLCLICFIMKYSFCFNNKDKVMPRQGKSNRLKTQQK